MSASASRRLFLSGVVLASVGLDVLTKVMAEARLAPGMHWVTRPLFGLLLVHNRGAMLGLGAGHPLLIDALAFLGTAFLLTWALRDRAGSLGAAVMAGGALGNLLNRVVYGPVIDFMKVAGWPGVFNAADVFIRVGAVIALWGLVRKARRQGA